jgi:hypothetical protein
MGQYVIYRFREGLWLRKNLQYFHWIWYAYETS